MVVYVQERGFYDDFWLLRRNSMYQRVESNGAYDVSVPVPTYNRHVQMTLILFRHTSAKHQAPAQLYLALAPAPHQQQQHPAPSNRLNSVMITTTTPQQQCLTAPRSCDTFVYVGATTGPESSGTLFGKNSDKGLASAFFGTGRFFSDTHHTADMAPPTKMGCIT